MKWFNYGLIDPRDKQMRYVGYTYNLKKRLNKHMNPSNLKGNTHKQNWLRQLKDLGMKPEIFVIEEHFTKNDAKQSEIELIEYFRFIGCDLTNTTKGGDGGNTQVWTPERRQAASDRMKGTNNPFYGKKHTEEDKELIRAARALQTNIGTYDRSGENNPMYGRHHTTKSKKLISDTKKHKG